MRLRGREIFLGFGSLSAIMWEMKPGCQVFGGCGGREVIAMQNDNTKVAVRGFQLKLDFFKTKIQHQQLLAQSLTAEFESLTSEFESLKQLFDASSFKFESISSDFESTLLNFGATSDNFESSSSQNDATFVKTGSLPDDGASSPIRELASLIRRSAKELKIYFGQPNIPNRMAEILLALREKKKLSVAEMRQITGVSRNSLVRDIKVLKLLGWLEFHGSRKNGYFTLTASVPNLLFRKESG